MFTRSTRRSTLAAGLAAMGMCLLAVGAPAQPAPGKLQLRAIINAPGGDSLLSGNYDAAIRELNAPAVAHQRGDMGVSTNLCVALIMTEQWDAARTRCDEAVSIAGYEQYAHSFPAKRERNELLALAYSNRAVLAWLRNQTDTAASDLARAYRLAPGADFIAANWARLNVQSTASGPAVAAAH